jgi:hypothetical protein
VSGLSEQSGEDRRQSGAERRGGIKESNWYTAISRWEPVADDSSQGRIMWCLANPKENSSPDKLDEVGTEPSDSLRERPECEPDADLVVEVNACRRRGCWPPALCCFQPLVDGSLGSWPTGSDAY